MGPEKVCVIVGACAVLHNIAVRLHEPMEDEEVDELADVDPYHGPQQGLSFVTIIMYYVTRDAYVTTSLWNKVSSCYPPS